MAVLKLRIPILGGPGFDTLQSNQLSNENPARRFFW
jgi:hypothetical protein